MHKVKAKAAPAFFAVLIIAVFGAFTLHESPRYSEGFVHYDGQNTALWTGIDSLPSVVEDSLPVDTPILSKPDSNSGVFRMSADTLDAPVKYKARDSVVYDIIGQMIYLYGQAEVTYDKINLKAAYIEFDWSNNTLTATGTEDSSGNVTGKPVFIEDEQTYRADKISYNFKTQKGKVHQIITQDGEGYIHLDEGKFTENNEWYGYHAKYTTCELDHPHFYIQSKKMKIVPDKLMVSGPANLVIGDVPTPLFVPFGIYPLKKGQRSGVLLPEYGESRNQGFFLRNGGYYFAINDYIDLALRGDIYSKGSYALRSFTNYKVRYKYSGRFSFQYGRTRFGEKEAPDFSVVNDFKFNWSHTQDAKLRPNSRFNANVNIGSATYDKNFSQNTSNFLNNAFNSNISYSKNWVGTPFSFSANLRHDQSLTTRRVNLTLPEIGLNMSRVFPFQRKVSGAKKKWYERIGFSYTMNAKSTFSGIDSTFFSSSTLRNGKYGMRHNIPLSTSFTLFKYLTIEPSFRYTERWYFKYTDKQWQGDTVYTGDGDTILPFLQTDTIYGFKAGRDFTTALSFTTRLYGMVQFKRGPVKAIRHVFTPSISFDYRPNFEDPRWGYIREVQNNIDGGTTTYSVFENVRTVYGAPPGGKSGRVVFNFGNVLEMKVRSKKDTVETYKKIKLLDRFNVSTNYNFAKDSVRLAPINMNGSTTLWEGIRLNFSGNFDPYISDPDNINNRLNTFVWQDRKRFLRMTDARISLTANISAKTFQKNKTNTKSKTGTKEEKDFVEDNPEYFSDFKIPWQVNVGYDLSIRIGNTANPDTVLLTQSLRFSGEINLTPKWRVSLDSGFDFVRKEFSYTVLNVTRDLHCWEMRFNFVPFPIERQSYSIDINVKSSVLQDLKLSKKKNWFDSAF